MNGYTKLFGSIIASTIWREDDKTRIVWITMLAMANKDGNVEASVPGLADMARVKIKECEAALMKLMSPDEYSRSREFDGKRIEEIDGGWHLLNHGKYRAKMNADDRREYLTKKQAERRARLREEALSTGVNKCQQMSTLSTHAEAEAKASKKAAHGVNRKYKEAFKKGLV